MAPVLGDAQAKGIKIGTSDTDAPELPRQVFVNQATADGIGKELTDALAEKMGSKGSYAIVSCGQTAANLNSWIAVQKKYTAQKYPNMKITSVVYAGEDEAKAVSMAKDLMNANPQLTGLVGECTSSAPGVAKAVREANKIGKVFTVGLGTPQAMKPYLTDGSSSAAILWDVEKLGYLTAWAGKQLADGKPLDPDATLKAKVPTATYVPGPEDAPARPGPADHQGQRRPVQVLSRRAPAPARPRRRSGVGPVPARRADDDDVRAGKRRALTERGPGAGPDAASRSGTAACGRCAGSTSSCSR